MHFSGKDLMASMDYFTFSIYDCNSVIIGTILEFVQNSCRQFEVAILYLMVRLISRVQLVIIF